jgi:hypothetical protein
MAGLNALSNSATVVFKHGFLEQSRDVTNGL